MTYLEYELAFDDLLDKARGEFLNWLCVKAYQELKSIQPKKGKWIDGNKGKWNAVYCPKCSVCGTPFYGIETARYHYCPNCGANMRGDIDD